MIALDAATLVEHGRPVLNGASFDFAPGIWHVADERPGDARLLIELLAGHRAPAAGAVRCAGARSWPLSRTAPFGFALSGLDMIDALASLYALDRRATVRLFAAMMPDADWLSVRFDRWPQRLQRHFGHVAFLAPTFDVYLLDVSPVLPERELYERWRALFQTRIAGKTVVVTSGDHRAALRDFPGARLTLARGALHRAETAAERAPPAMAAE